MFRRKKIEKPVDTLTYAKIISDAVDYINFLRDSRQDWRRVACDAMNALRIEVAEDERGSITGFHSATAQQVITDFQALCKSDKEYHTRLNNGGVR
jgi:hypothetical protein